MEAKEKKSEVELVEVPTETALVFQLPDGTKVDSNVYLVWIGNMLLDIRKRVG